MAINTLRDPADEAVALPGVQGCRAQGIEHTSPWNVGENCRSFLMGSTSSAGHCVRRSDSRWTGPAGNALQPLQFTVVASSPTGSRRHVYCRCSHAMPASGEISCVSAPLEVGARAATARAGAARAERTGRA